LPPSAIARSLIECQDAVPGLEVEIVQQGCSAELPRKLLKNEGVVSVKIVTGGLAEKLDS